jgi:predicted aspartyl protease
MKTEKTTFQRQDEESLMLIDFTINRSTVLLAFDTGATHTVIDFTALLLMGIVIPKNAETVLLESAKGIIEAQVVQVSECRFCGITRQNFNILTYDYLANGVLADIDGVLGLDFLQGHKFCIDMSNSELSILKSKNRKEI